MGTRTVLAVVLAETFGLTPDKIKVNIGSSKMPVSGPSGGSTTVGGICESHRRAGQDAFASIAELVGKKLGVDPAKLEAIGGRIQVAGDASKSVSWKEACTLIGMRPLEVTGSYKSGTNSPLSNKQVGGVQMARCRRRSRHRHREDEEVRRRPGHRPRGLPHTSGKPGLWLCRHGDCNGAVRAADYGSQDGAFVNAELANYKLPRLGDIGEVVCEFYEPESERSRGVIGIGEPPVISPGAAISNAVCNALGVRVPVLPITPQRVLAALKAKA